MFNGKVVEVIHGDYEGEGSFLFYRQNGDILTPHTELPFWAEGVVQVNTNEYANYWATALPAETAGIKLSADRVDIRDLNLITIDPQSRESGDLELMEQPADIAFRMSLVRELLDLDLSVADASDAVPSLEGWRTVTERELDTTYLDTPGNDEVTLAQAEADGFGSILPEKAKEFSRSSGS